MKISPALSTYIALATLCFAGSTNAFGQNSGKELIRYGDFSNWVTRNIKESHIIGGNMRQVYEIAPNQTIDGDEPYSNLGNSPWATSNVMAKVCP